MSVDLNEEVATEAVGPAQWPRRLRLAVAELMVAAIGYIVYSLSCGAVHQHQALAFQNAASVVSFERRLGILHEQQLQAMILPHSWLVQAFNAVYMWGHLPLIIALAVWLFIYHRRHYRLIRNALLISGGIALLLFYGFPLAPPRLVPGLHLVDTAAMISPVYDTVEPKVFFNPYAAMPSMHIGWDLLMGLGLVLCSSKAFLRWCGGLLPFFMLFAVVVTGNHYIVDGLAGAIVGLAGLAAGLWIEHLRLGYGISGASLGSELPIA